jgi:hypothetical protein
MQSGFTPAYIASEKGHTEILALLLANKADINAANKVQSLKYSNYYDRFATNCRINAILRA